MQYCPSDPVDTRRRFNVDTTSCDIVRRRIDVETTSCVYWECGLKLALRIPQAGSGK